MSIANALLMAASNTAFPPLGDILPSCVYDLDATIRYSYSGTGQVWANYEPTPADGAAQSDYNFNRGAGSGSGSDDPTFVGTPGNPSAYWLLDGGDFFRIPTNTAFINGLHKSNDSTPWTWLVVYESDLDSGGSETFISNCVVGTDGTTGVYMFYRDGEEALNLSRARGGSSRYSYNPVSPSPEIGTWSFVASGRGKTTDVSRIWPSGTTTSVQETASWPSNTSNPSGNLTIGAGSNGTVGLANGSKIVASSMFNELLSDAEMLLIMQQYEKRHKRSYT